MSDLAEFLLARIAEDEAVAHAAVGTAAFQKQTGRWSFENVQHQDRDVPIVFALADRGGKAQVANMETAWERDERGVQIARWDPARVLAECDAKRRIVEIHKPIRFTHSRWPIDCLECDSVQQPWPCATLLVLALPYVDHPQYDESWRP